MLFQFFYKKENTLCTRNNFIYIIIQYDKFINFYNNNYTNYTNRDYYNNSN